MQSKPTNPKKHVAAPCMMPANPKGAKPPLPHPWLSSGHVTLRVSGDKFQFATSAENNHSPGNLIVLMKGPNFT